MSITDITEAPAQSNVQWGAVFAGATLTTALALILLTFGAALGLSVASPYDGDGFSPVAFAVAAGLYLLWVQLMSFYIGGYVVARLRPRAPGLTEHEIDVRDGLHGFLVWGVGVLAAAVIAFAGIGGAAATANTIPTEPASVSASVAEVVDQQVDESVAEEAQSEPQAAVASPEERRAEIARRFSVISAFITAASLLVGAVAAFFGAQAGGNHRDRNITWVFFNSQARLGR